MNEINHLDFEDGPIEYDMLLKPAKKEASPTFTLPSLLSTMFASDPSIAGVTVEYHVDASGKKTVTTLPIIFWEYSGGVAREIPFENLNIEALKVLGSALATYSEFNSSALTSECMLQYLKDSELGPNDYLLGIYMRDVSFSLPSDIGYNMASLDGAKWSTKHDLSAIMQAIVGNAWYKPADSNHKHLEQRKHCDKQAKIFDAIFQQMTNIEIKTTLRTP